MQTLALNILKHLATLVSCWGQRKLFVLIYHRVLDEADFMRPGETDKQAFAWQMQLLATYFNVLPIDDALVRLQNGGLPPRAVMITFDDGYADNLHNALPILKQNQLKATFFIASGYLDGGRMWNDTLIEAIRLMPGRTLDLADIGFGVFSIGTHAEKAATASAVIKKLKHLAPDLRLAYARHIGKWVTGLPDDLMLTSAELKVLHDEGMEIGGHTVTHPILAKLDTDSVLKEVKENKAFLGQLLNTSIRYFAYPNGKLGEDYVLEQVGLVKNNGYSAAFSTQVGVADQSSPLWQLPRFTPWDATPVKFMLRMVLMYRKTRFS